jgi:hypothetical protein
MRPKGVSGRVPTKKMSRSRIGLILSMVLLALTVGTMAMTRTSTQAQKKKYVATKEIVRDKVTGQLRKPTAEETDAMVDQLKTFTNQSTEGLTPRQHANGMVSMSLEGRFGGVVLGRDNADGTTEVRCVFTMEEAADFLGLEETTSPE